MNEQKGNIIFDFLKRLNKCDDLVFAEIAKNEINANNDGEILDFIKENDIIRSKKGTFEYDALVYITQNGRNILKFDSWKEYIDAVSNEQNEKFQIEKVRQEKQDEKLDIDIYLGNFEKKQGTKFKQFGFALTVINLIIVVVGIIISTQSNNKSKDQEYLRQEHIEKSIKKLENQILTLERKSDSIYRQPTKKND
ncbi:MAG: hypothetical protein CMH48_12630 [Muricauda sp.]|nr:hypothetical protein [Allomuricauda sp.]MBC31674.1 hypothetical protein [Allomuricauda sp.]|tara:strand:- start:8303 stop:8887 length:585 start_codon:yes stop_codon:yes gene_type:complete